MHSNVWNKPASPLASIIPYLSRITRCDMVDEMAKNIIPQNEAPRLAALRQFNILHTSAEEAFDNITKMMAQVFNVPMSFVSLVDKDTVFYKSQVGPFGHDKVARTDSLCSLTILGREPLVFEDTLQAAALQGNPYVYSEGGIRFYAGAPLHTKQGYQIGTVCLVDTVARSFSEADKNLLVRFAGLVMHEIEMRQAVNYQAATEEQLNASYKELQFVTDTMPQLVWATEPDGYSFFFNKGWLQYTGLSFNEIKGNGWTQSLHPDDFEATLNAWNTAVQTGGTYDVEYRLKRNDGIYRWFVARGTPMKDAEGTILKWYGTSTDIEDQKQAQIDLRKSKERFDLVSKATQDAIWDWNLATDQIWWNEGFKELFGYKQEDIEPDINSWYSRVHPDDKERVVGGIHTVINNGGKQWTDEYRFRKKDGTYAIVYDRGYALHNAEGKPYRILGSMQDVTIAKKQQIKLAQSEKRFQAAIAAVEGVLWTNDADGKMEGEQPGWTALTGQTHEEYKGFGWAQKVHPDDAQPTIDAWMEALKERKIFRFEHRLQRKDGQWRLFSIKAVPVTEKNGAIREWVGVHTDITDHREAEEKIRRSEQRFQNLVQDATVGIIVVTGNTMQVEVVNNAYGRLIGRKADDILHKNLFDVIPEAELTFRPIIEQVRTTGQPLYLYDQPYLVFADGNPIEGYLNLVYQPYHETDGTCTGVMVLCQDVTTQMLTRKQVEEAEETARLAIDSAELGTFNVNLQTNQVTSSERLETIFEIAQTSERDRYVSAIHPEDLSLRTKAYEEAFQTGLLKYEARLIRKSGITRWIRVRGRIFFDEKTTPRKMVGVVQDITEEKEFAEELTRQVRERTQELEQFTFVSHHDLQEPLRKMILFTEMVRTDTQQSLSDSTIARLDKVITSARRMSTALRDVLNFASLNKVEMFVAVHLTETAAIVANDLEVVIAEKKAQLNMEALPVIRAVPQQMHQLFYNLVNNALKFSQPNVSPVITITSNTLTEDEKLKHPELKSGRQYYQITVQDNGIGFDQKAADKVFVLFQRLHSKDAYPGTGIGLALCKKVVSNHGGKITVESTPGKGTSFFIYLPA